MTTNLAGVLTDVGAQLIEEAYQAGKTVVITKMALGDGGGNPVEVKPSVTKLVREFHRQLLDNGVAEDAILGGSINYIPQADHRGKWLREFGLLDASGNLIVYAAYSPSQIPENPNMAAQFIIGMMVPVMNIEAIEVQVNPEGTVTQEEFHNHTHKLTLSGDATGSVTLGKDGATLEVTVKDDSHSHTIDNVDGLQQALDSKSPSNHTHPGTLTNPFSLVKEDLNTITKPGAYRQDNDGNATLALNYPEAKSGSLIVTAGAGVQHRYHVYNTSRVYTRAQFDTGAFTPWARDYNTLNKPTPDELGAYPKTGGPLGGGVDAQGAIYGRVWLIARSRAGSNGGTWLGMEAPEDVDPYISAKVSAENAPSKVISFGRHEITALKRLAADSVRVGANGGLKFSPYEDFRGRTWGAGMDPANGMWGLHRYQDGTWVGQDFGVSSDGVVKMNSLVVDGGSESKYHQVRSSTNPSLELHEPGKHAVMMYKPMGTANVRFCQSNGAGGEAQGYAEIGAFGVKSLTKFKAELNNNRTWPAKGHLSYNAPGIATHSGALFGVLGQSFNMAGAYDIEMFYGYQTLGNASDCGHTFAAIDGGSYTQVWTLRNGGQLESPGGWRIAPNGDLFSPRLSGKNVVDWAMDSFAVKQAASGNADVVAGTYQAIGAYVFAALIHTAGKTSHGQRVSGANLRPCSCYEYGYAGYSLPGTWQCMGDIMNANDDDRYDDRATLWVRVA
ncbi:phage tail-collar fiber domain-containing protein [Aeromonas sp. ASNIH4]|uniref:phage tail-collar fiber domain-containing protein n=3 Tax=Aeromonas TaxID=642 RepID=UPI000CECD2B4|nr:phage tail protein [Aeromonas sp. ASNIH4]AUZ77133.1 hypothetical protein C2U40_21400 [Aeromonas sp. ASNIH4]